MKKNKILISGVSGQVGWELVQSCSLWGDVIALDRMQFDLSNSDSVAKVIREIQPNVLINSAAYTAVDKAESEAELCHQINAKAVGIMSEECKKINATLVHFSTDYVFNGEKKSPYLETDEHHPINIYGKSKAEGEKNIQAVGGNYFIYRVSWVYSHRGHNFLKTMLKLAAQKSELNIVSDQVGAPTWARFIAEGVSLSLAHRERLDLSGVYHMVPHGETNWSGFAQCIFSRAQKKGLIEKTPVVHSIMTEQYPTPARRPLSSRLSNKKFIETFGLPLQSWEQYLELCIRSL